MRLAISNIAWDTPEDETIADLLHLYNIDAIDIAPGKYFSEPCNATDAEIAQTRDWWHQRGIEITGMQALLFGTTGLNVFGSDTSQNAMLNHLASICHIGSGLGARRLVFGSPKNRDRTGLSDREAIDIGINFFRRLGDIAQSCGVVICLEPNPTCYGANFMTNCVETVHMVTEIDHSAIKMQLDTGANTINNEDFVTMLQENAHLVGHIHASEPDLLPLGDSRTDHAKVAQALKKHLPDHIVSIEMLATRTEPHKVSVERALHVAIQHYRNNKKG